MKVNFDIEDNYALSIEGRHIDLHNNFNFVGFDYDFVNKEINMKWRKSNGKWVHKSECLSLVMTHKGVTFLKAMNQEENNKNIDDYCLGEITYFPSSERENNDSIMPQSKPKENDDILYIFENGQLIRINCEEIELIVNTNNNAY